MIGGAGLVVGLVGFVPVLWLLWLVVAVWIFCSRVGIESWLCCSCFLGVLGIEIELPYIEAGFGFFDRGVLLFPRIYP
jgi:hypothetical protein